MTLQWGNVIAEQTIEIYLYPESGSLDTAGLALTCSPQDNTCRVTFDDSYTSTSENYWLFIKYQGSQTVVATSTVLVSTLTVVGDSATRSNSIILKETFALGPFRYHRIYSSTPKKLSVVLTASNAEHYDLYNGNGAATLIRAYQEAADTSSGYILETPITLITPNGRRLQTTTDASAFTLTYEFDLNAGYYWIVIDLGANGYPADNDWKTYAGNKYRLSYSTEVYSCPFINDYPDYSGIFRGCEFASDNSKLPCIDFNDLTGVCRECFTGYALVNGRCV